ncbi:unnamed protein product [Amoebophrya sp. A25]|nr:unnamed protein product [Amoebophrya sp. A25]|eukprot:GSA25T00023093001.1
MQEEGSYGKNRQKKGLNQPRHCKIYHRHFRTFFLSTNNNCTTNEGSTK